MVNAQSECKIATRGTVLTDAKDIAIANAIGDATTYDRKVIIRPYRARTRVPPTWEDFRARVRRQDRDSLLLFAAKATSAIARDEMPVEFRKYGLNPWNLASVARTALAWSSFQRPQPTEKQFLSLCSMDASLASEVSLANTDEDQDERLGRVFSRMFFEQFPGQRHLPAEVARTLLLFGSASQMPPGFQPEAMTSRWFERASNGLSLEEYVGAIFLVFVVAGKSDGIFDVERLNGHEFSEIGALVDLAAVGRIFIDLLVTTPEAFKTENRKWQDPLPEVQKKYAFNPLQDKPFIMIDKNTSVAPWVQAILMKALPPAIYHLALDAYGEAFTHDLGRVFQHYVGRQLRQISGKRVVTPEVRYGARKCRRDSCDWLLDLPGLLVLVECKARQPIESLRTGGLDWMQSVEGSIGKAIAQLNRSNQDVEKIAAVNPTTDPSKKRIGLVVTLEPFYVNNNPMLQQRLPPADLPIGVMSIGEIESLVCADADAVATALMNAPVRNDNNLMLLAQAADAPAERENDLLADAWESIPLFKRIETLSE